MKNKLIILALICALSSQTQCSLTERLSAADSKIATVRVDAKAGKLNVKDQCQAACNTGGSCTCRGR